MVLVYQLFNKFLSIHNKNLSRIYYNFLQISVMNQFNNKDDVVEQRHGCYWKFSLIVETDGSVVAHSSNRTYTNDSTKNGFGFKTPAVYKKNGEELRGNYSIRYYGFNINPTAYKQMKINSGKLERPSFIPKYCWDRNQSFALFVPEIIGSSEHVSGK